MICDIANHTLEEIDVAAYDSNPTIGPGRAVYTHNIIIDIFR